MCLASTHLNAIGVLLVIILSLTGYGLLGVLVLAPAIFKLPSDILQAALGSNFTIDEFNNILASIPHPPATMVNGTEECRRRCKLL